MIENIQGISTAIARPVPRMRYPEQALLELKREDPSTPVTIYMIKRLMAAGAIPFHQIGRRRLLNFDILEEYLANPPEKEPHEQYGVIRRVSK